MSARFLVVLVLVAGAGNGVAGAQAPASATWSFDSDTPGRPPPGFAFGRTGRGATGRWEVQAAKDAPSGKHVLAQLDTDDTDSRFPVAVAARPSVKDLKLSVRCKMISGKVDQACGLVFRYKDENNYYITRANALEDNVRLYFVKDGRRKQLASFKGKVTAGAWHSYSVQAKGKAITVAWDGKQVLAVEDSTFSEAGKIGVWTKADSVTLFDDLAVSPAK
jgi:hypothetical protein